MPSEGVTEIWRQHCSGQDKYTYFLLAAAASAMHLRSRRLTGQRYLGICFPWDWLSSAGALAFIAAARISFGFRRHSLQTTASCSYRKGSTRSDQITQRFSLRREMVFGLRRIERKECTVPCHLAV